MSTSNIRISLFYFFFNVRKLRGVPSNWRLIRLCVFFSSLISILMFLVYNGAVLSTFRFLDTSLIDIEVQPAYVRVTVKGKVFQLALNDEICVARATSQRSAATGNLLIKMPKLKCGGDGVVVLQPTAVEPPRGAINVQQVAAAVDYKNIVCSVVKKEEKIIHNDMPDLV